MSVAVKVCLLAALGVIAFGHSAALAAPPILRMHCTGAHFDGPGDPDAMAIEVQSLVSSESKPQLEADLASAKTAIAVVDDLRHRLKAGEGLGEGYAAAEHSAKLSRSASDPLIAELFWRAALDSFGRDHFTAATKRTAWAAGLSDGAVQIAYAAVSSRDWCGTDEANTQWLKAQIARRGWFRRSTDGDEADKAAWLLVQHADRDKPFQKQVLELLQLLLVSQETAPSSYAYLFDRVAVGEGRPQRYGTQGKCTGPETWTEFAVEDPATLDQTRAAVGLGPMDKRRRSMRGLCLAQAAAPAQKATADRATGMAIVPRCDDSAAPVDLCQSMPPAPALTALKARVGDGLIYRVDGEYLDVLYKRKDATFEMGTAPYLCCDLDTFLEPIGPDAWAARIHVPDLDRAVLNLGVSNVKPYAPFQTYVGSHADHSPLKAGEPSAETRASIKTIDIDSAALGERRKIFVYNGRLCAKLAPPCRVVYLADGIGFETFIDNAPTDLRPLLDRLVIVGLDDPAFVPGEDRRSAELLSDFHKPAFDAFEGFLIKEVMPKVEGDAQGSIPRMVGGFSDGGAWALSMGLRHPNMFCDVLAFSSALWTAPLDFPGPRDHTVIWMGSGAFEENVHPTRHDRAVALRRLGLKVSEKYFTGGHSMVVWNALFWWVLADQKAAGEKCDKR